MKLHELKPASGSAKNRKRVGRGPGSGHGKTAGRGHKGQKSRSGNKRKPGFEGGQTPLQRRVPKLRGFKNLFKKEYTVINLEKLNVFKANSVVTREDLVERGFLKKAGAPVKILGEGELKKVLTVQAHNFSKVARQKIEQAGGKVEVL